MSLSRGQHSLCCTQEPSQAWEAFLSSGLQSSSHKEERLSFPATCSPFPSHLHPQLGMEEGPAVPVSGIHPLQQPPLPTETLR